MHSILVTNPPPETDDLYQGGVLDLFHRYGREQSGRAYAPYTHQTAVFDHVMAGREVFHVAGTAAGKTLSVATPLFHKLALGSIRHILFLYPTIALMEDQRRVMDGLARLTQLDIGVIQGGMSRSEVVEALNKPVILATPDAIYWFFHKNVKYSSLLIYGLALIDECVLDEAHLFNGLMLQNLTRLKERMQLLAERLGKRSRWHILTATPTVQLRAVARGEEVHGQSKCGDVSVHFHEPLANSFEYPRHMAQAVTAACAAQAQKVLVVLNAADMAHRLFERVRRDGVDLPVEVLVQFGCVRWPVLEQWLEQEDIEAETLADIRDALAQEHVPHLCDLARGDQVLLEVEHVLRHCSELVEHYRSLLKWLIRAADNDQVRDIHARVTSQLQTMKADLRLFWHACRFPPDAGQDANSLLHSLDAWTDTFLRALELRCQQDQLAATAPAFMEIRSVLQQAGASELLAASLSTSLSRLLDVPPHDDASCEAASRVLGQYPVMLCWLTQTVRSPGRAETLRQHLYTALQTGHLRADTRSIAGWLSSRIPVIVYTGKMSKGERHGLIDAFARLERAVLLSTPAVEVGVDFAVDTLITEECDGNAFLQRFGRVGRRAGSLGRVIVFLRHQGADVLIARAPHTMTRQAFSELIAHPTTGVFRRRSYVRDSFFVDAVHYLINVYLGRIGDWLNARMFGEDIAHLGRQLLQGSLGFSYGLRSTLPGVSLQGGAGGGEPFYLLTKVENKDLLISESPFELARSEMPYLEFLYASPVCKAIVIDTGATLDASRALFWRDGRHWRVRVADGIVRDYATLFSPLPVRTGRTLAAYLDALRGEITGDIKAFLHRLSANSSGRMTRLFANVGEALPLYFAPEPQRRLLLGMGNVYLRRLMQEGQTEWVEDGEGNRLALADQLWLLLLGYNREEARKLLKQADCLDLDEVLYVWHTCELAKSHGVLLLDRTSGACFSVYERMVRDAVRPL